MPKPELVDITCFVKHETEKAYLIDDGTRQVWIPKSQAELDSSGKADVVTMPLWLARDKGLV